MGFYILSVFFYHYIDRALLLTQTCLTTIDRRMDRLPSILKEDGYHDVQAFKRLYDDATILVEQYNRDLAVWERQVHGGQQPPQAPPEKESIRKKLWDMEAETKRRNDARRQQTHHRSYDYDRGR